VEGNLESVAKSSEYSAFVYLRINSPGELISGLVLKVLATADLAI
jgi:hypothetical protein